jgi:tetratricopeptide (TPR) repeat protein
MSKRNRDARKKHKHEVKTEIRRTASPQGAPEESALPRDPEIDYQKALHKAEGGDLDSAVDILTALIERSPDYTPAWASLSELQLMRMWPAHALRSGRIALAGGLDAESEAGIREVMSVARSVIHEERHLKDLSEDAAEEAMLLHEAALQDMEENRYGEALANAEEALRLAPRHPSPRNNRATLLFLLGRTEEALEECNFVLDRIDRDNLFARSNRASFLCILGRIEDAAQDLKWLRKTLERMPGKDRVLIHAIAVAFALVEDGVALSRLAAVLPPKEIASLFPETRYIIAAGCINSGAVESAEAALAQPPPVPKEVPGVGELRARIRSGKKKEVSHPWKVPYLFQCPFLSEEAREALYSMDTSAEKRPAEQVLEDCQNAFRKFPALIHELALHLRIPEGSELAGDILANSHLPAAAYWLKRFAESDNGPDSARSRAAQQLVECTGGQPVTLRFWRADLKRWTEVRTQQNIIADPDQPWYSAAVMNALEQGVLAMRKRDFRRAEKAFRKAVELDPHCGQAYYNLGVIRHEMGEDDAGEKLIRRSVKAQPDYWNGYVTLAGQAEMEGDIAAARRYLSTVFGAARIAPEVAAKAFYVHIKIQDRADDVDGARASLASLETIGPGAPFLKEARRIVRGLEKRRTEIAARKKMRTEKTAHRMARNIETPITLAAAVARLDEADQHAIARRHRIGDRAGKDGLPETIAKALLAAKTPAAWRRTLRELTPPARRALRWLLAAPNGRAFDEFVQEYAGESDGYFEGFDYGEPSPANELWLLGVLAAGTRAGERIVAVPEEVRAVLEEGMPDDDPA